MSRHFGHVWALQCGCQGASCHCFDRRCCALAFASSWLWATLSYCICLILPYLVSPLSHLSCILLRIRICFVLLIFAHLAAVFSTKSQPRGSGERLTYRRDECGGIWIIWINLGRVLDVLWTSMLWTSMDLLYLVVSSCISSCIFLCDLVNLEARWSKWARPWNHVWGGISFSQLNRAAD